MYGTQAGLLARDCFVLFENDVKMYGTQAAEAINNTPERLRMM